MNTVLKFETATQKGFCGIHGEYESRLICGRIWTKCTKCAEEANQRDRELAAEKERESRIRRWELAMGRAGIPERFRDRSLESYVAETDGQKKALAFSTKYANEFDDVLKVGRCAIFCGRPGTGKNHLAIGIGLQVMEHGRTVLFTSVLRAVRRVKDTWRRDSEETETQAVAALAFPDLLILDEVGVQFGSEAEKLILFDILNERYEARKPTILISNLPLNEVKTFLGERIFDRMREDGGEVVPFTWESHRGRAA